MYICKSSSENNTQNFLFLFYLIYLLLNNLPIRKEFLSQLIKGMSFPPPPPRMILVHTYMIN